MITEISVSVPNRPNEMAKVLKILAEVKVNVLGFAIEPAGSYSIIRMICYPLEEAKQQLKKYAYSVEETLVFAIRLPQKYGKLFMVMELFGKNEINIEYGYLTLVPCSNDAIVFLKSSGEDEEWGDIAKKVLKENELIDLSNNDLVKISSG